MPDPSAELAVKPETFLSHWRDIRDAKDELGSMATQVARNKKAAKRDGVDLDVLKLVEKLAQMESDERTAFMRTVSIYTTWLELPLGAFSVGLEVQQPKQSSREDFTRWQAGQDGAKAGLDGTPREANPHIGGSKEHQAWDTRWSRSFNSQQNKRATVMAKKARNGASRTTGKMAAAGEGLPSALN